MSSFVPEKSASGIPVMNLLTDVIGIPDLEPSSQGHPFPLPQSSVSVRLVSESWMGFADFGAAVGFATK